MADTADHDEGVIRVSRDMPSDFRQPLMAGSDRFPRMEPVTFALDDIPWEPANAAGTRSAILAGTREPGVTFTYAFFLPGGVWDGPHSHGADIHLVVAAGELTLTFEEPWRSETSRRYATGSFLHVPAGAVHADGARTDTVIIGTTVGPWSTRAR